MKKLLSLLILACCLCSSAYSDHFRTRIITASSTAEERTIEVPEGQTLRIIDFVQNENLATPHYVEVEKDGESARVLIAGSSENAQARDTVLVAGPATVTITAPIGTTKLFLTFRKRGNDHGDP